MSFCPYITFTIVSLCQWNTIASYGKCLLVIRRCLKLYPVSMPVRCDIDLTVIFKSCRALYCLSIPIPFIMPNRLTGAPYLALSNYAIYAYLIYITHIHIIRKPRVLIAFCKCGHDQLYNDGCSSHFIYYCFCTPQIGVQLITSSVGFVAPSSLQSQLYHTWFYLSSIIFVISIPIATPAANEPRQDNKIIINYQSRPYSSWFQ